MNIPTPSPTTTTTVTLVRSFLTKTISPIVAARALSGRVADRGILFSAACPIDYHEEIASTPVDTSAFVEKGILFSAPFLNVDQSPSDDDETGGNTPSLRASSAPSSSTDFEQDRLMTSQFETCRRITHFIAPLSMAEKTRQPLYYKTLFPLALPTFRQDISLQLYFPLVSMSFM
jgi:hypothetical protein